MAEEKHVYKETATKVSAELSVVAILALILVPIIMGFLSSITQFGLPDSLMNFLFQVKLIATIISMIGIGIAVYSFVRLREITGAETKDLGLVLHWEHERTEKNLRWERVEELMRSLNPSDWKVAILEADNILDEVIVRMGYRGESLGERMKKIEPSDFPYLEDAWKAHKTRNEIAHQGGVEYVLTRSLAEGTINIYHRIFKELGYL